MKMLDDVKTAKVMMAYYNFEGVWAKIEALHKFAQPKRGTAQPGWPHGRRQQKFLWIVASSLDIPLAYAVL